MRGALVAALVVLTCVPAHAQWQPATGPEGGAISAVAIDPLDADSIYAGGKGLFHSGDGGKTWQRVDDLPETPHKLNIKSIAISRDQDGPIIVGPVPCFVSRDRGETWQLIGPSLAKGVYGNVHVGPAGSRVMYATSYERIFRSNSNGATWWELSARPKELPHVESFQADRFDANTISFMCRQKEETSLVISRDGGESFKTIPFPEGQEQALSMSTDPEDRGILYICTQKPTWQRNAQRRYYYSYDNGASWDLLWDPETEAEPDPATTRKVNEVFPGMRASPAPAWGGMMLFRSELSCSENEPGRLVGVLIGRVFRSDDYGKNWEPATTGLVATAIERIVFDPEDVNVAYCSDMRHVWRTADRGKTWEAVPIEEYWFVRQITFSPDAKHVFVVSNGIWRGTRDGKDWQHVWPTPDYKAPPMAVFFHTRKRDDGETEQVAVHVGSGYLLESTDGGTEWRQAGENNLEISPTQYIKRARHRREGERDVWLIHDAHGPFMMSTDHGRTWAKFEQAKHYPDDEWSLADDGSLWMAGRAKLSFAASPQERPPRSRTWNFARFTAVVCEPADARVAYAAREGGRILRTTDGGETFEALEGGPSGVDVIHLALSPHDGALWVATAGNGVWILDNPKAQPGKRVEQ